MNTVNAVNMETSKFRHTLDKGSKKHICPSCGKKTFVLYIDQQTGDYLPERFGRCDREEKCGHWERPNKEEAFLQAQKAYRPKPRPIPPPLFVETSHFKASLKGYGQNNFFQFLAMKFGEAKARELADLYKIGTSSSRWEGATVFWYIDKEGKIRRGSVMLYNGATGKRIKDPTTGRAMITSYHALTGQAERKPEDCLFGEHLLKKHPSQTVALVESEKTAIVASAFYPDFLWMAVGGKAYLNERRCRPLKGRKVVLFPDLSPADSKSPAFQDWKGKAGKLADIVKAEFYVSDLLEKNASETARAEGCDLADYLLGFSLQEWNKEEDKDGEAILPDDRGQGDGKQEESILPDGWKRCGKTGAILNQHEYPAAWDEPQTPKETFAIMAERNPALLVLKDKLQLDITG